MTLFKKPQGLRPKPRKESEVLLGVAQSEPMLPDKLSYYLQRPRVVHPGDPPFALQRVVTHHG